jgi:predicted MFS family arabinose efflux permease
VTSVAALALVGVTSRVWVALAVMGAWAIVFAATIPVREAFINGLIPSDQRATVLSSDNLLSSAGGVAVQPVLGRIADAWGYPASYVVGAGIELMALPLVLLAGREKAASDRIGPDP